MTEKEKLVQWVADQKKRYLKCIEELEAGNETAEMIAEWLDHIQADEDEGIISTYLTPTRLTIHTHSTQKSKEVVDYMMQSFFDIKEFKISFTGWSEPRWSYLGKLGEVNLTIEPAPQTPDCNLKRKEMVEVRWVCEM